MSLSPSGVNFKARRTPSKNGGTCSSWSSTRAGCAGPPRRRFRSRSRRRRRVRPRRENTCTRSRSRAWSAPSRAKRTPRSVKKPVHRERLVLARIFGQLVDVKIRIALVAQAQIRQIQDALADNLAGGGRAQINSSPRGVRAWSRVRPRHVDRPWSPRIIACNASAAWRAAPGARSSTRFSTRRVNVGLGLHCARAPPTGAGSARKTAKPGRRFRD